MDRSGSKLYLENQLCYPLYATSRLTTQIYTPYLKELNLTYPQYLVLLVLWQHTEQTVNEIGNKLMLESNTLTPLLKRLEQKKLIVRARSEADERSVIISLTKKGDQLKNKAMNIPDRLMFAFKDSDITVTEIRKFQQTLFKLMDALGKKNIAGEKSSTRKAC
jgi:DNA-binding MarR family transcriptional regulator